LSVIAAALMLLSAGTAYATAITNHSGFSAGQTVLTFDDVSGEGTTAITTQYASQGVTFSGVFYGYASSYNYFSWPGSGAGTATDFAGNSCPCTNDVTATFSGTVRRAGFDAVVNSGDSIELTAYKSGVLVDDQTFTMATIPSTTFVGLDVPGRFDVLVIQVVGSSNHAFAMDDFRFDGLVGGSVWVPPPPHAAMCSVPGNTNPFTGAPIPPGTFLDLLAAQITSDPHYVGATPAIYVEGKGLTCDPPPPGYTQQGYAGNAQHVAENFYPYWAPPPKS
jgi:hypothetical protein